MVADYKTRLPNQFEDSSNLRDLIDLCAAQIAEGNTILEYLRDSTTLDLAVGVWLDEIGEIVGVSRGAPQVVDAEIFTYRGESAPELPALGFLDPIGVTGGRYVGIDGLPDGALLDDTDYRLLIRAKIASTYSGDSIPEMWAWIDLVFGVDADVYTSGPAEVGIDLPVYMTHTQRRLLEKYIPRAAGIGVGILSWPPPYAPVPGPFEEDD